MPELPEVETVRRTLEPHLVGRRVARADLRRPDILRGDSSPAALLQGATIHALQRRGKQLAILASSRAAKPRILLVHLGMTGQLIHHAGKADPLSTTHVHALWTLSGGGTLLFRDPRRFGGLWSIPSVADLEARWAALGPDGLVITGDRLAAAAGRSARAIKASLLDQAVVAGVGNIYADEALFRAGIRPRRASRLLTRHDFERLAVAIREVLHAAVEARGSSIRDYVDGSGFPGKAQLAHAVYGKGGLPCRVCGTRLRSAQVAQRTTVWCPTCQR